METQKSTPPAESEQPNNPGKPFFWKITLRHKTGLIILGSIILLWSAVVILFSLLAHRGWERFPADNVGFIRVDSLGRVWKVGNARNHCQGVSLAVENHWQTFTDQNSALPDNCVNQIFFDDQEGIWVTTDSTITVFAGQDPLLLQNGTILPPNSFIQYPHINVVRVDPAGKVWVGTKEGVSIFDGETWVNYPDSDNSVTEIIFDSPDSAWIEVSHGVVSMQGPKFTTYYLDQWWRSGSWDMNQDPQGRIWIKDNKNFPYGLIIIDGSKQEKIFTPQKSLVADYTLDQQGIAWVLTENGLYTFDGQNWVEVFWQKSYWGFVDIDPQGRLWVLNSQGLQIQDGKTWHTFTPNNSGLRSTDINQIDYEQMEFDQAGRAWIVGNRIFPEVETLDILTYDKAKVWPTTIFTSRPMNWYVPFVLSLIWISMLPALDPLRLKLKEPSEVFERLVLGVLSGVLAAIVLLVPIDFPVISPLLLGLIVGILSGGLIFGSLSKKKRSGAVVGGVVGTIMVILWLMVSFKDYM